MNLIKEETEAKDIEWLKKWVEEYENKITKELGNKHATDFMTTRLHGGQSAVKEIKYRINQLDEPETLSQEWIDDNKKDSGVHYIGYYVPIGRLHDLLVPKQKLVEENKRLNGLLITMQEEVDQAYKDGYEKGKQHTFYKGYLEGLADKESEPETVADVIADFYKSLERLKEVLITEVKELEE